LNYRTIKLSDKMAREILKS